MVPRAANRTVAPDRAGRQSVDRVGGLALYLFLTWLALVAGPPAQAAVEAAERAVATSNHQLPAAPSVGTPVCPFEDAAHCQGIESGNFIHPIDRSIGQRIADDFRPATDTISRICWFPCFVGDDQAGGSFECSANTGGTPPPDDFVAVFYEDDLGLPGLPVAGQPPGGYSLIPDDKLPLDGGAGNSRCWRYTAPLDPPLSVTSGECYWMEITGVGEQQAEGYCGVYQIDTQDGNNLAYRDSNNAWEPGDLVTLDLSWCLDSGIVGATDPPTSLDGGCGDITPTACCKPGNPVPVCTDGSYIDCVGTPTAPGWGIPVLHQTCAELGECPRPPNDDCATGRQVICGPNGEGLGTRIHPDSDIGICANRPALVCSLSDQSSCHEPWSSLDYGPCIDPPMPGLTYRCMEVGTNNRLATTDGPATTFPGPPGVQTCQLSGMHSFQADIWYEYTAECTGEALISMCGMTTYDGMLAVYSSESADCVCPTDNTTLKECDDDFCPDVTTAAVTISVIKGVCYTIRVGGWSSQGTAAGAQQDESELDIRVACDTPPILNAPLIAQPPHDVQKNRYLSFVPNNPDKRSFKIRRTSPGDPVDVGWVSPPEAGGFAKVQAAMPATRTWTEPLIHVGDCEIVPDAVYEISATAEGVDFGPPLIVSTVPRPEPKFWGDTVGAFESGAWTAPNGVVNTNDFLAALQKFQNLPTAPHVTVTDVQSVSSTDPCLNRVTNIADVFILIQAFQGNAYPFTTDPASCPPCP